MDNGSIGATSYLPTSYLPTSFLLSASLTISGIGDGRCDLGSTLT
jgi:hypothetical protein